MTYRGDGPFDTRSSVALLRTGDPIVEMGPSIRAPLSRYSGQVTG